MRRRHRSASLTTEQSWYLHAKYNSVDTDWSSSHRRVQKLRVAKAKVVRPSGCPVPERLLEADIRGLSSRKRPAEAASFIHAIRVDGVVGEDSKLTYAGYPMDGYACTLSSLCTESARKSRTFDVFQLHAHQPLVHATCSGGPYVVARHEPCAYLVEFGHVRSLCEALVNPSDGFREHTAVAMCATTWGDMSVIERISLLYSGVKLIVVYRAADAQLRMHRVGVVSPAEFEVRDTDGAYADVWSYLLAAGVTH